MKRHLQFSFRPRIGPEQRLYRNQLTKLLVKLLFAALSIWLLAYFAFPFFLSNALPKGIACNLIAIGIIALLGNYTRRLIQHDHIINAGYLISIAYFLLTVSLLAIYPTYIYFVSPIFILVIVALGTIIGGGTAYIAAAIIMPILILAWFIANANIGDASIFFEPPSGVIFLLTNFLLLFGMASLIDRLSHNIQASLEILHRQTEQLTSLAHTDPLTRLANRRYLIELLDREYARARRYQRPLTLIYIDLDGLKKINDRFGHMFGDEILRGSARSMEAVLRTTDLLARVGGDEFAVLLPETNLQGAAYVTDKLRKAIKAYGNQLNPVLPGLTFCSGIGSLRNNDTSIDDILSRADQAQSLAKSAGKDQTRTELDL
jgi:diguanylate cyclase (GGDEF)-like protein